MMPKCGKCQHGNFIGHEKNISGMNLTFIVCSGCGTPAGVVKN